MKKPREIHLVAAIKQVLGTRVPKRIEDAAGRFRHAGVLVPLMVEDGQCQVLFTKRTQTVEHHKGQISFPGGAVDEGDVSMTETALREAYEEIGLSKEDVEILGRMDDVLTLASNFLIHPLVGLVPSRYRFHISREEVERIIKVPLQAFVPGGSGRGEGFFEYEGKTYETPTFEYQGDVVWGATARIMENFMCVVGNEILLLWEQK